MTTQWCSTSQVTFSLYVCHHPWFDCCSELEFGTSSPLLEQSSSSLDRPGACFVSYVPIVQGCTVTRVHYRHIIISLQSYLLLLVFHHPLTLGLNPSFSANPPYLSLSFFSFRIHYMNFLDCLLLLLSISVFLLFSFFLFLHFFSCRFRAVD